MAELEDRMLVLETTIKHIDESLTEIRNDAREFRADIRNDVREFRADVKSDIQRLSDKADSNLRWIIGVVLVTWITTTGAIVGGLIAVN